MVNFYIPMDAVFVRFSVSIRQHTFHYSALVSIGRIFTVYVVPHDLTFNI